MKSIAKPFVKWVGGKGQLLSQLELEFVIVLHKFYGFNF